jgi:hypothetical protein
LWLSFPGPITGSLVGGARVLSIALALLSPVAAINYPCCGGSPSKGNGINRFCDWLLGRLCSRWLRLHSCRCHQLSLLWRLAFQGKCRFQLPCLALLSAVLTLAALLLAPPPSAAFAVAAHLPRVMSFAPALVSPPSAVIAVAAGHPRPMLSPVHGTGALVSCARAICARTLSPPSAVLAVAAGHPRAMLSLVPVTGSLVGCACAGCARTRVADIAVGGLRLDFHRLQCV